MQAPLALERKVQILTRLAEISSGLNSTLKLKPLLSNIMDATVEITDSEAASILLWDHKANDLRFAATTTGSSAADLIGKPVPLEGSIAGTILRENRMVLVDNVENDPRHYSKVDEEIEFRTRSILGVPMTSKNRVIGVLEAVNKRAGKWTPDDCHYLGILAAQAAVAIEGAQMVAQLQRAYEELSQLDKMKNDFIALASHELRTPLGVILGYASFLQETNDPQVADHAAKVVNSALQLRRIIEDLTNLRFLQGGAEAELKRVNVTLAELLRDVEHDTRSIAGATKLKLRFLPAPDATLNVDRGLVAVAITNVVNNAVRFTPEGGDITVKAEVRAPHVVISVSDTGIGFEKEQADKLFDQFYQVEDHMTRKYGGLGIGLSITKGTVEAHGGRIAAYSPGLNQGATFTIILPMA